MTDDEFWSATDQLKLIHQWARASYVAPWALILAVLLRVIASTGPKVMLPGPPAPASLNMGLVLIGRSGAGKGVTDKLSRVLWSADIHEEGLGSGQGIHELYKEQKNPEDRITRALISVSEIDHLTALNAGQGNNTRAALKAGLTGDRLGSKGASSATTRVVPADSYRLCLSISAQFGHTGVLMDDVTGGTPQRLLWAPVTDPDMPDEPGPTPDDVLDAKLPSWSMADDKVVLIQYGPPEIREYINAGLLANGRGEGDALDAHRTLVRCKVAAALAILDHRMVVSALDWELSEHIMAKSDATRTAVLEYDRQAARAKVRDRAMSRAGSDAYERAFAKWYTGGSTGHLRWTPEEADAYRRVEGLRDELRALGIGGSGNGGDAMVPLSLDPAILLSNNGSTSSLRQIARVETIATNSWNGVSSAGVTAEWRDEFEESSDGTPTLDDPSVPVHRGSAFVPYSFEVEQDAVRFVAELQKILLDSALQLSDAAYTTGTGTGEPTGFITSLVASAGTVPLIAPATAETLVAGDVYAVQNALPPRFQANARWTANLAILNTLRQMETTNGALKFPSLQDNPPSLLGRMVHEQSNMDGTFNAAATASNYLLAYGDWSQFLIVDRIGATMERVDHLLGSNRRPNGSRGALLWWRTGSDVLMPQAFRLLNIATTA
jgi:HK97 family phage major capsid protein